MELLISDIKPCSTLSRSFAQAFEESLYEYNSLRIATGYVSEDSLVELQSLLRVYNEENLRKQCVIIIGMHGREGFTKAQYDAAIELASFLEQNSLGEVRVCTAFKFHGKTYTFANQNTNEPHRAIVGSSNLGNILDSRQCEVDICIDNETIVHNLESFVLDLQLKASKRLLDLPTPESFLDNGDLFRDREGVIPVTEEEFRACERVLTDKVFDIPLKVEEKSNLNAFFGKGRRSATGAIRPRHWYEVELIVPVEITQAHGYPRRDEVITVVTDDHWKFDCAVQGDYGKNFRSNNDLKILGRWIKGRLERANCLRVGQLVTESVLQAYGRKSVSLKATSDPKVWMLDFSV